MAPKSNSKSVKNLTLDDDKVIRSRLDSGETAKSIASDYGVHVNAVHASHRRTKNNRKTDIPLEAQKVPNLKAIYEKVKKHFFASKIWPSY